MKKKKNSFPFERKMGSYFSNANQYRKNPNLVILDAKGLQSRLLRHAQKGHIDIVLMEEVPFACNYTYDPSSFVAQDDSIFDNFYRCQFPLYVHMGTLRFCSGCEIVLTQKQYQMVTDLDQKNGVPLTKEDKLHIAGWSPVKNFFCF
jgi:hypothetical protein